MKKNITFFIASMNGGGAERITMYMVNELIKRKWDVTLLLCVKEGENLKLIDSQAKVIKLKYDSVFLNLFTLRQYFKDHNPDNFYSVMNYINVVTMLAVKMAKYKGNVILAEHTSVVINNIKGKLIRYLEKKLYPSASKIICISEGVKKTVISSTGSLENIIILPNPVVLSDLKKQSRKDNVFRFISIGRLETEKNFDLLLKSFARVVKQEISKKFELFIFGEGNQRKNLENLIENLGINQEVSLKGFTQKPFQELASSDCFVLSSDNEGLPTVLIEALSVGLPVISTDCPSGPAEILKNGEYGKLVPVNDLDALSKAMMEEFYGKTASNELSRIKRSKDFSADSVMDQYEILLKK